MQRAPIPQALVLVMVSVTFALTAVAAYGQYSGVGLVTTIISTQTTTFEVTYNYLTITNGSTYFSGFMTTTTMAYLLTTTSTSASLSSTISQSTGNQTNIIPIPGFTAESILIGLVIGIGMLVVVRVRSKLSMR